MPERAGLDRIFMWLTLHQWLKSAIERIDKANVIKEIVNFEIKGFEVIHLNLINFERWLRENRPLSETHFYLNKDITYEKPFLLNCFVFEID